VELAAENRKQKADTIHREEGFHEETILKQAGQTLKKKKKGIGCREPKSIPAPGS